MQGPESDFLPVESAEMSDRELLFDLSTVQNLIDADADNKLQGNVLPRQLVCSNRFALDGSGKAIIEQDVFVSYDMPSEKNDAPTLIDPFDLFDARVVPSADSSSHYAKRELAIGDVYSASSPLMPCAKYKLENVDRGFSEPVRDRNKDYKAEQMQLLSGVTCEPDYAELYLMKSHEKKHLSEKSTGSLSKSKSLPAGLKMGKYKINLDVPPNFWSPQFQSLLRRTKILRCTKYISETYCVIDVFGIGISGRVFSGGPGRMIIVEAYSTWNCETHVILLTVPMLKEMLAGDESLFRPGNKRKLVDTLLSYLYFTYTIQPAKLESAANSRRSSRSVARLTTAIGRGSSHGHTPGAGSGTSYASRPVTSILDHLPEGIDEDLSRPASRFGTNVPELQSIPSASVIAEDAASSEIDAIQIPIEDMSRREARLIFRQVHNEDPIYRGLIPSGVEAPLDLSQWDSMRTVQLEQLLIQKKIGAKPLLFPSSFQIFEQGSPPTVANTSPSTCEWAESSKPPANDEKLGDADVTSQESGRSDLLGEASPLSTGRTQASHSSVQTRQSALEEAVQNLLPKFDLRTQIIEDIEEPRPIRPDLVGYPITISQIIRALGDSSVGEDIVSNWKGYGLPVLTQELKVGTFTREKAWHFREEKERVRLKIESEQDAARKAAWLAIPPMKRGYRMRRGLFSMGRMVVLSAYIFPHKPANVVIKGHVLNECKNLLINLSLSTIGNFYGEKRAPKQWPAELVDPMVKQAMSEIKCKLTGDDPRDGLCSLRIRDTSAFETQLSRNLRKIALKSNFLDKRAAFVDFRQLVQIGDIDMHEHRIFPESRFYFRDLPFAKPKTPATLKSGSLQFSGSDETQLGKYFPMPRRHIGRKRVFTKPLHVQGASCICSLYLVSPLIPFVSLPLPKDDDKPIEKKAAELAFGNVPVPIRKVRRLFKRTDEAYATDLPRIDRERNLWGMLDAAEKAAQKKAAADARERERVRIHNERVAMYKHLEDLKHVLTPEEFRRKYLNSLASLNEKEFKDLWSMQNSGVWHHVYLHMLNDKHDLELKEKQAKLKELEDAERAADVERWEKEEAERIHQQEILDERMRKVHEYRHNMLHAVTKREGENHDEYMMRRMKEAIAMKKLLGILELEDLQRQEEENAKDAEKSSLVEIEFEKAESDEDDDDWNEGRDSPTFLANEFLDSYAPKFEVEVELYFSHEAFMTGSSIPAQSVIRFTIRREDIYRMLPTFAERLYVLRLGYQCFFDLSSEFEIELMYTKWRDIIVRKSFLTDNCRWVNMQPSELLTRRRLLQEEAERLRALKIAEDLAWNGEELTEQNGEMDKSAKITENVAATSQKSVIPINSLSKKGAAVADKVALETVRDDSRDASNLNLDEVSLDDDKNSEGGDDSSFGEPENGIAVGDAAEKPEEVSYVPPQPPLSQKDILLLRSRVLEKHAEHYSHSVYKVPNRTKLALKDSAMDDSDSSFANEHTMKVIPILTWPASGTHTAPHAIPLIIFRKSVPIKTTIQPHKTRLMFVEVWIKGSRDMGIIGYDVRDGYKMYTAELDSEFQASTASLYQYNSQKERNGGLHVILAEEFSFGETVCADGVSRLMLEHKTLFDEDNPEENDEVLNMVDDFDFEAIAAVAKQEAEEANAAKAEKMAGVKLRLADAKRKQKEENELERLGLAPMSVGSASDSKVSAKQFGDDDSIISELTEVNRRNEPGEQLINNDLEEDTDEGDHEEPRDDEEREEEEEPMDNEEREEEEEPGDDEEREEGGEEEEKDTLK